MASQRHPHVEIRYDAGTIVVRERHGVDEDWAKLLPERHVSESRVDAFRGPALASHSLMLQMFRGALITDAYAASTCT